MPGAQTVGGGQETVEFDPTTGGQPDQMPPSPPVSLSNFLSGNSAANVRAIQAALSQLGGTATVEVQVIGPTKPSAGQVTGLVSGIAETMAQRGYAGPREAIVVASSDGAYTTPPAPCAPVGVSIARDQNGVLLSGGEIGPGTAIQQIRAGGHGGSGHTH